MGTREANHQLAKAGSCYHTAGMEEQGEGRVNGPRGGTQVGLSSGIWSQGRAVAAAREAL